MSFLGRSFVVGFIGRHEQQFVRTRTIAAFASFSTRSGIQIPSKRSTRLYSATNNQDKLLLNNNRNVKDQVVSCLSGDGGLKVTAVTLRNVLNEFALLPSNNNQVEEELSTGDSSSSSLLLSPLACHVLGRLTTCAILMSNGMQAEQTVQLTLNGDGPLGGAVAISDGKAQVRGYVGNPSVQPPPPIDENNNILQDWNTMISNTIGKGAVQVVKNHPDWPNPYNGITALRTDSGVDENIGIYLAESEQRSCALAAWTLFRQENNMNADSLFLCTHCGGYLVEQLPGVLDSTVERVEENLSRLQIPQQLLEEKEDDFNTISLRDKTPLEICHLILDGLDPQILKNDDGKYYEPKFKCNCSAERVLRIMALLPREEVEDLLEKEGKLEAKCQFCTRVYRMGPDEVRRRLASAQGDPSKDDEFRLEEN